MHTYIHTYIHTYVTFSAPELSAPAVDRPEVLLHHGRVSGVHRGAERGAAVSGPVLVPGPQRRGHQEAARGRGRGTGNGTGRGILLPAAQGEEQEGVWQGSR